MTHADEIIIRAKRLDIANEIAWFQSLVTVIVEGDRETAIAAIRAAIRLKKRELAKLEEEKITE